MARDEAAGGLSEAQTHATVNLRGIFHTLKMEPFVSRVPEVAAEKIRFRTNDPTAAARQQGWKRGRKTVARVNLCTRAGRFSKEKIAK